MLKFLFVWVVVAWVVSTMVLPKMFDRALNKRNYNDKE